MFSAQRNFTRESAVPGIKCFPARDFFIQIFLRRPQAGQIMLGSATGIARHSGDAVKIVGKFLLWILAYAVGAALIVALFARRPSPPATTPEPAAQSEAPASTPAANDAPASEDVAAPTSDSAPAAVAAPPEPTGRERSQPRRVKSLRIPSN
jgi:hypothetical protein